MKNLSGGLAIGSVLLAALAAAGAWADDVPKVLDLRAQQCPNGLYFHIRLARPTDMESDEIRLPQLIPQDSKTRAVYVHESRGRLEFTGKIDHWRKAAFKLIYPSFEEAPDPGSGQNQKMVRKPIWTEMDFTVDLQQARWLPTHRLNQRTNRLVTEESDLEERWADAQVRNFHRFAEQSGDFSFYRFAAQATARKYGIRFDEVNAATAVSRLDDEAANRRLYETTTGAAAITGSLQLHRLLGGGKSKEARVIDIGKVPGIDIAEHPWAKMMGDKRPSPEPFAKLVPHDNYFIHFKSVRKFIEFGELLDQWGTNVLRAYEINSRDYQIKERYEKQLCLKSTWLGKTFGPAVIRGLALTGNDAYLREGSDVTIIFQVVDRNAFLAAVEPFLQAAKLEFGDQLRESKTNYRGDMIESFATSLREISLHRATVDDMVIYSNSPVAVRRCLDANRGRSKALADSLDYQYMRTIFRLEDEQEDGFTFLSDAFIRQLVGPASKIKEKRRLEALTSLQMATNGALFTAWETGKGPESFAILLAEAHVRPEELVLPEGGELSWNNQHDRAVSDVYNTLHFATPLVELPVDRITPSEDTEYRRFREQYLGLWRRYFDPVGMRFQLTDRRVRVETYILPLIRNSQYDSLRDMTGRRLIGLRPSQFAANTLAQLTLGGGGPEDAKERLIVRLDDGPMFQQVVDWWRRGQQSPNQEWWQEALRMFLQLPVVVGIEELKDPRATVDNIERTADNFLTEKREKFDYHGHTVTKAILKPDIIQVAAQFLGLTDINPKQNENLYHVLIGNAWYVSFSKSAIKAVIDEAIARQARPGGAQPEEVVEVNSSFYLAPKAFNQSRAALRSFLEWETQRRALVNNTIIYPLYRTGLIAKDASEADARAKAFQWYGFIPVSPDGAAYVYDASRDEVVNKRHGTPRQPLYHAGPADDSPLAHLLDQLQSVRADLRFREDGVHTVLTMERKSK
jgi:hypothetical protein